MRDIILDARGELFAVVTSVSDAGHCLTEALDWLEPSAVSEKQRNSEAAACVDLACKEIDAAIARLETIKTGLKGATS